MIGVDCCNFLISIKFCFKFHFFNTGFCFQHFRFLSLFHIFYISDRSTNFFIGFYDRYFFCWKEIVRSDNSNKMSYCKSRQKLNWCLFIQSVEHTLIIFSSYLHSFKMMTYWFIVCPKRSYCSKGTCYPSRVKYTHNHFYFLVEFNCTLCDFSSAFSWFTTICHWYVIALADGYILKHMASRTTLPKKCKIFVILGTSNLEVSPTPDNFHWRVIVLASIYFLMHKASWTIL